MLVQCSSPNVSTWQTMLCLGILDSSPDGLASFVCMGIVNVSFIRFIFIILFNFYNNFAR